ncbi:hypothetical protein EJ07DRAFT_169544 [Lizonia empirigonia]|nr:hypothetical protein EJ07DRAFT_169544 [Lizonia empirigonia]
MRPRTLTLCALLVDATTASYAFYVGKALTEDGSVMVGGTGEEVSSHWLEIFPAKDYPPNATVEVGVTEDKRLNISQAAHTFRYLSMEYSDYEGFPAPLTNGGVSEKGIAVRDVWAQNRDELIAITPNPQTGLQYSDLARVVMERASTAREGVEIIGQMIADHLIADANEGWVVWEMSGGQKLWAAERLGEDVVRVLYPGYIEEFPVDFANSTDYLGSPNIVSFAGGNYTARDGGYKYMSQAALENATLAMAPVSERDLIERVRDYRIADDEAGYGQVVSLHADMDPDLIQVWVAPTGSVTAPFNPWWLGVRSVSPEYGQHRYLTADAASTFLDTDFQYQEATDFAGRIYKQALYYTCSDPENLLPIVQNMLHGFENASFSDLAWVERSAKMLVENDQRDDALDLLTFYAHTRADKALSLGKTMIDALDAYIKLTGQFRTPSGSRINDPGLGAETVNCLVGRDPDQPAEQQTPLRRRR